MVMVDIFLKFLDVICYGGLFRRSNILFGRWWGGVGVHGVHCNRTWYYSGGAFTIIKVVIMVLATTLGGFAIIDVVTR